MTKIEKAIRDKEIDNLVFKPDRTFYERVNIRQKRWGLIYRGEADPTITEIKAIAQFFNILVNELI